VHCDDALDVPKVFASDWGPNADQRQIVVGYWLSLGAMGATLVTLESYVWDKDGNKVHRTSRGGGELKGCRAGFQQLAWYPTTDEYWIMVSGIPLGWSGRTYGGKAFLYSVRIDRVRLVWASGDLPSLRVQTNELGWEASYADADSFYGNLPNPNVFDVYKFNYDAHTFERVIRYRY
jgi:hypothetical protein